VSGGGLNPDKYTRLEEPKLRFGHTSVVHKNLMFVFGGWDGNVTLNDLNVFDLDHSTWYQVNHVSGQVKGRYRHSASSTDQSMFVFGGIDQQQERFNDIIEYNFEANSWSRVVTIGNPPSPRTFHQSIIFQGFLYVLGGFDGMKRNDMYRILVDNSPMFNQSLSSFQSLAEAEPQ